MNKADCFELGYISKAHGIRGEVIARFDVDDISFYEELKSVYLEQQGKLTSFFIDELHITPHQGGVRMKLRGIDSRTDAESLRGSTLWLPEEMLPELSEDQFFYHEIVGYTIEDERYGELGAVTDVREMPAQDLLVLVHEGKEILIPLTDEFLVDLDRDEKKLYTALPEGLIEVFLDPGAPEEEE